MEVLGPASESDMIDAFRDAEPERWLTRGYPDNAIFTFFPLADCDWCWASLEREELMNVRHIRNEPTWLAIAGADRSPSEALRWVNAHPGDEFSETVRAIHARLIRGEKLPAIVLVQPADGGEIVVMEGNKRTVAAIMDDVEVGALPVLLGRSPRMREWAFYDD